MHLLKFIPNTLTMLNLFSGILAVLCIHHDNFWGGFLFLILGVFFDFFDGFFARLFKVNGDLGLQLDSLADAVTSGLVPGYVMYKLLAYSLGVNNKLLFVTGELTSSVTNHLLPFTGFLITIAAVYRLAKFNIAVDQKDSFVGLPTPANAIFIVSLALIIRDTGYTNLDFLNSIYILLGITILSCYLMNSNIRLFALKFKTFDFSSNKLRYAFIVSVIILLSVFKLIAVPVVIVIYVVFSLLFNTNKTIS